MTREELVKARADMARAEELQQASAPYTPAYRAPTTRSELVEARRIRSEQQALAPAPQPHATVTGSIGDSYSNQTRQDAPLMTSHPPNQSVGSPAPEEEMGWFQSGVQSVAKIITKPIATVAGLGAGIVETAKSLPGGISPQEHAMIQKKLSEQHDFGYFGKARPMAYSQETGEAQTGLEFAKDYIGTTLEGLSYLAGGAGLKLAGLGSKAFLSAAGKEVIKKEIKKKALKHTVKVAGIEAGAGATGAAGSAMQEQQDLGGVTKSAAIGGLFGGAIGGAIGGASSAFIVRKAIKQLGVDATPQAIVKLVAETIDSAFTKPKFEVKFLEVGKTPEQARNMVFNYGRLSKEIAELENAIKTDKFDLDNLITTRSKTTKAASAADNKKIFDEVIPRRLKQAQRRLEILTAKPGKLARRVLKEAKDLPPNILAKVTRSFDNLSKGDVIAEEFDVAMREVRDIFEDSSDLLGESTESVAKIENSFKEFTSSTKEIAELNSKLGNNGELIRKDLIGGLSERAGRRRDTIYAGKSRQIKERIIKKEAKVKKMRKEKTYLKNHEVYKIVEEAMEEGLDLKKVISTRGAIIGKAERAEIANLKGIKWLESTIMNAKTSDRIAQTMDENYRGYFMKNAFEPMTDAVYFAEQTTKKELQALETMVKNANLKPKGKLRTKFTKEGKKADAINAAMHRYGEKIATKADLDLLSWEQKNIVDWGRAKYSEKINAINKVRAETNMELIKVRANYVTHIQDLTFAQEMGMSLSTAKVPDLDLQDMTKNKPSFGSEKARVEGAEYKENFIESLASYLPGANKQIEIAKPAAKVNAIIDLLKDERDQKFWRQWINEFAMDAVTNIDKESDRLFRLGVSRIFAKFGRMSGAFALAGNMNNLFQQASVLPVTGGLAGIRNTAVAVSQALTPSGRAFVKKNSKGYNSRSFYTADLGIKDLSKVEKVLSFFNEKSDEEMYLTSFLAFFRQAKKMGQPEADAVRWADLKAGQVNVVYKKSHVPMMLRSKIGKTVFQFKSYPVNIWNLFYHDTILKMKIEGRVPAAKHFLSLLASIKVSNGIYQMTGQAPPNDDTFMGVRPWTGGFNKFGPGMIIKQIQAAFGFVYGQDYKRAEHLEEMSNLLLLPIKGGGQIKKTLKGVRAIDRGYTKVFDEEVPLEGVLEQARALLFGPGRTVASMEEYKRQEKERDEKRNVKQNKKRKKIKQDKRMSDIRRRMHEASK